MKCPHCGAEIKLEQSARLRLVKAPEPKAKPANPKAKVSKEKKK